MASARVVFSVCSSAPLAGPAKGSIRAVKLVVSAQSMAQSVGSQSSIIGRSCEPIFGSVRLFRISVVVGSVRFGLFWKSVRFVFFFGSVRFFRPRGRSSVRFGSVFFWNRFGSFFFFRFGSVFSAPRKIVGSNRFGFFVVFFSVRFGSTTYGWTF